jgi:hypothetical protein
MEPFLLAGSPIHAISLLRKSFIQSRWLAIR